MYRAVAADSQKVCNGLRNAGIYRVVIGYAASTIGRGTPGARLAWTRARRTSAPALVSAVPYIVRE
jgi:hypothetical protein